MNIDLENIQVIGNSGMSSIGIGTYQSINWAKLNNITFIGNDQSDPTYGGGALNLIRMNYVNKRTGTARYK